MTTIAAESSPPCGGGGITIEALTRVDLNYLTQRDLKALSRSSDAFFDVGRRDDVVSPQIDRSLFNESAGSRRQTYSRRLHHSRRSHSRFPNLKPQLENQNPNSDAVTTSIVHFLKHFLDGNFNPPSPPKAAPPPVDVNDFGFLGSEDAKVGRKRKRLGKAGKLSLKRQNEDRAFGFKRVNFRGQVVNLELLQRDGDRICEEELGRKTVGLETEEGALGFLAGLEGEWCSRRKKRKYVDTGLFGDLFPVGWKVLLGLRRREYRVSIYCRRFVSPTGQHFLSCKDVAAFLKSYFAMNDDEHQRDQKTCSIQQAYSTSGKENDCFVENIDTLPEVHVKDIFECLKCNVAFEEKNMYLQHLLSVHEKVTKRYEFGTPLAEGAFIEDGKCSDDFVIPIDVQQTSESSMMDVRSSMSLKIDSLFEVPQNPGFVSLDAGAGVPEILNHAGIMLGSENTHTTPKKSEEILTSDSRDIHTEDSSANRFLEENLDQCSEAPTGANAVVSNECPWSANMQADIGCPSDLMHAECEIEKGSNIEYGDRTFEPLNDGVEDTPGLAIEEMLFDDEIHTFQFFPSADSLLTKETHEPSATNQNIENAMGFGYSRPDGIDQLKYVSMDALELRSPLVGREGASNIFDNAIEEGGSNITVCVWCRAEFKLDGIESEAPSDSIGYICPSCKSRIPANDSICF